MTEILFFAALTVFGAGALVSLLLGRRYPESANRAGAALAAAGGLLTVAASGWALFGGAGFDLKAGWSVPWGSLHVGMDGLSAFFGVAIGGVCFLAAVYGGAYLRGHASGRNMGVCWFFYNILAASMLMVVAARNGVLFLVVWELMTLASFFLVIYENDRPAVLRAGWIYLIAAHLATAFLLVLFVSLGIRAGSMEFSDFALKGSSGPTAALFLLAVVGFGAKAGFLPLHVWLPEAHPAAPSHVSAVMSGVMIKTGIYGLLRMVEFLGPPQGWWGWMLIGIGTASGLFGVVFAMGQHDLKRLLAYSSVENVGIICLGLGLGLLGLSVHNAALTVLGFLGGLLHVWNHALFKSLLFMGAGAVVRATGTRDVELLGGLARRMPWTAGTFLAASAAICGLPPFNGFVSEFLIFSGAYAGVSAWGGSIPLAVAGVIVILSLAFIGGLAAACFTKAFGVVFLGEPRTPNAAAADEAPRAMLTATVILAGLCLTIGLACPLAIRAVIPAARVLAPAYFSAGSELLNEKVGILMWVGIGSGLILAFSAVLALVRRRLLKGRIVETRVTWDCGYAEPAARMQYTASSFIRPTLKLFGWLIHPIEKFRGPAGLFPGRSSLETHVPDVFERFGYRPAFEFVDRLAGRIHRLQEGRNQLYVLYIAVTLLILLVWKLGVIR